VLLNSGMPLADTLETLVSQVESRALQAVLSDMRGKVLQGASLADATRAHPAWFPELYTNMVKAGEATGNLGSVLQHVARFRQKAERIAGKVSAALTYPVIMVVVGVGVVLFLLAFVVPRLAQVLTGMGRVLPLPTLILVKLSDLVASQWWAMAGAAFLVVVACRFILKTGAGRGFRDRVLLRLPVFRRLFQKQALSRLALTLSSLLRTGVPVLDALTAAGAVAGNTVFQRAMEQARESVLTGEDIADSLRQTGRFPPLFTNMVSMGEQRGNVDETLAELAEEYTEEIETAVQRLIALLEPAIIIVMACAVAFIVLAILLPILEVSNIAM